MTMEQRMEREHDAWQTGIERRALLIGAGANLVMAFAAWITYYLSNSEAILLDGNYTFILFLGTLVALAINGVKAQRSHTFPLGKFFLEALYSFMKGLMLLGVLLVAVVTSVVRIVFYIHGDTGNIPMLNPDPILWYALGVGFACFALSLFYRWQNRRLRGASSMLATDAEAAQVDGVLSLGIAVGVFFLRNVEPGGAAGFVPYLADSLITLVLAALLVGKPVAILRDSVIELAAGRLQDGVVSREMEGAVGAALPEGFTLRDVFTSKTGSRYLLLVTLTPDDVSGATAWRGVPAMRETLRARLAERYPHIMVEILIR
jgi:divalent metal cation (Fe/Co/Zn/Cd) transporter